MKNLIAAGLLALALTPVFAADEPYTLKADKNLAAVLGDLSGKTVTLHLHSGEKLSGKLSVVGSKAVQLSELSGKEFYDAVIAIDKIDAVELRARSR